jgi:mono/diheme cytochrome c family protein
MLGFSHLGSDRIEQLTRVVQKFRRDGLMSLLAPEARDMDQLLEWVDHELKEPAAMVVPPRPILDAMAPARGQLTYTTLCSTCHGALGRAENPPPAVTVGDEPYFPRDLARGVLKGGETPEDLFRRVRCGMPGTVMPSVPKSVLSDSATWDLISYLQTLIPTGAQALHQTVGPQIIVARIEGACPTAANDPRMVDLPAVAVPVVPFRRDEATISGILVQAASDGKHLIFRVRYADDSLNPSPISGQGGLPPDGLAVRLSANALAPVLPIPGQPLPLDRALWLAGSMPEERDPVFDSKTPRFENPDSVCKSPIGPERVGDGLWVDRVWTILIPVRPERSGNVSEGGPKAVSFAVFDGRHARGPLPVCFSPWCVLK